MEIILEGPNYNSWLEEIVLQFMNKGGMIKLVESGVESNFIPPMFDARRKQEHLTKSDKIAKYQIKDNFLVDKEGAWVLIDNWQYHQQINIVDVKSGKIKQDKYNLNKKDLFKYILQSTADTIRNKIKIDENYSKIR